MTPFHQDNYFWNVIGARAVNIWIACSKANKKNGGVCYLEKSHQLGTINHVISYKKGTSQKIPDFVLKSLKFKRVYPSLNKGDAIIHNCEVIHGSYENNSSRNRVGLVFSYKAKDAKYDKSKIDLYHKIKRNLLRSIKVHTIRYLIKFTSKGIVTPLNEIILFFTTNETNLPISSGSGTFPPGKLFSNFFILVPSFLRRFTSLFVFIGPGAIFINLIFFFE